MDWFEAIPKVELHVHLEGAIPHEALWELIRKYGGDPSAPDLEALRRRFAYRDFGHFIETWSWKNRFLREYDDFTHIAELTARDFAGQNIRYVEMFFSPSLFARRGLEVQRIAEAVRAGLDRVPEVEISLIADLVRDYGPDIESETLDRLKETKSLGVIGIGIGGSEQEFPPDAFAAVYEQARNHGFRTTVHAGEAAGPESIWAALNTLRPDRVGHGARAFEDERLVRHLAEECIPVEACPVSNVRTGVVESVSRHPIRGYFLQGVLLSVNTDDPKMFDTALAAELRLLCNEGGFSRDDIRELVRQGIESSWLPPGRKKELERDFQSHPAWREAD